MKIHRVLEGVREILAEVLDETSDYSSVDMDFVREKVLMSLELLDAVSGHVGDDEEYEEEEEE